MTERGERSEVRGEIPEPPASAGGDNAANPYQSPASAEIERSIPALPRISRTKALAIAALALAAGPAGWFLLCCALGLLYRGEALAMLSNTDDLQHFYRGLPFALFAGVACAVGAIAGAARHVQRQSSEYTRHRLSEEDKR